MLGQQNSPKGSIAEVCILPKGYMLGLHQRGVGLSQKLWSAITAGCFSTLFMTLLNLEAA